MGSQILTLAALEQEYHADKEGFRDKAVSILFPSALLGTALAARGDAPFRAPQRWACIAGMKAAGLLGMKPELSIALVLAERLGARDEAETDRLLNAARKARAASADDAFRMAKELVRQRIAKDPIERRRVAQELFGVMEVADVLPPAALNGHTNGNGAHS